MKNNFLLRGLQLVKYTRRHDLRYNVRDVTFAGDANKESSEVCGIIKPGRRVKLNRSQAVNVHKLLTIRYLRTGRDIHVQNITKCAAYKIYLTWIFFMRTFIKTNTRDWLWRIIKDICCIPAVSPQDLPYIDLQVSAEYLYHLSQVNFFS